MMTPEQQPRREMEAEVQRLLAGARPEQIHRLLRDILEKDQDVPERRAS